MRRGRSSMTNGTLLLLALFMSAVALPAAAQEEIVCIQCHGAQTGRLNAPVELWRGSVHAGNGVACNDCHGGDPKDLVNAMSPARGFLGVPKQEAIPAFCGRCHVGVLKDYLQSAHGRALGRGGPTCVTCHGNHRVVKASLALINEKTCTQCHSFARARIIRDAMAGTEGLIDAQEKRIAASRDTGIDTGNLEKGLFAVRNRYHTLFHDVDAEKVQRESGAIKAELGKISATLDGIDEQHRKRRLAGAAVIGGALLLALLFHLLRKTYD